MKINDKVAITQYKNWIKSNPVKKLSVTEANKLDKVMREKCKNTVSEEFKKEWGNGLIEEKKYTMVANYKSHYNIKMQKCFYLLDATSVQRNGNDIEIRNIMDVQEHSVFGSFNSDKLNGVSFCNVKAVKCSSEKEWNSMTMPFMND